MVSTIRLHINQTKFKFPANLFNSIGMGFNPFDKIINANWL